MKDTSRSLEELREIPKIELHLHLEGSMEPQQLWRLARRYGTDLAEAGEQAIADHLYSFSTFQQFLNAYKICCQHLRTPEDYANLAGELIGKLDEQGCVYAEIFLTPSICEKFGVPVDETIQAVLGRCASGSGGCRVRWIFDNVRQWGPDPCWRTLEWAERYRAQGVVGISMGGEEESQPARAFREVFEAAEKQGMRRTVHAGETCGPRSVWEAVEELRAERIGHGLAVLQDPVLGEYLKRLNIPLDISITSNFKTGVANSAAPHPLAEIGRQGLAFTLNSDDPGLFQTTLLREWELAATLLRWGPEQFVELMRATLEHTFLSKAERESVGKLLK